GHVPDRATARLDEPDALALALQPHVFRDAGAADLLDFLHQLQVDAVLVDDIARAVGHGDDLAAELLHLFQRIDGDVARARAHHLLAVEAGAFGLRHRFDEIGVAVARRLGPRARAAVEQRLAGQHPGFVAVGQALVLAEHIADLAPADADVAGLNVGVFAQVAVQFQHEGLA